MSLIGWLIAASEAKGKTWPYFVYDADARPVLLEKESMARTVQELGVGFKGGRLVENPKTRNATLLPEGKEEGWFSTIRKWFSP